MIEAGSNSRDRAIIACFYESGARRGEQLAVKLKNVELDEYGLYSHFRKVRQARRVRLIFYPISAGMAGRSSKKG